jgi:hypothetical protein
MQECLDENILRGADGSPEFPIQEANHRLSIHLKAQLPPGLACQRYGYEVCSLPIRGLQRDVVYLG